jgi:hypothetical protein
VGIFLYLLTPSSPSSWCGRRGRLFVDVRDIVVDDPGSAVGGRSPDGAPTVDQSWTAGLPAIGDPRMTSSPPPLAGAFGADQPHLSTSDPGCPPNPALFPHGWRQKRGECPLVELFVASRPARPSGPAFVICSPGDHSSRLDASPTSRRVWPAAEALSCAHHAVACGVPVPRAPVAIVWQKCLPSRGHVTKRRSLRMGGQGKAAPRTAVNALGCA